jgi:hypothetical protein
VLHCSQAEQQRILPEQGGWGHLFLRQITSHIPGHVAKVWLNSSDDNLKVLWECRAWPFTAIEQTPMNRIKQWQDVLEYYSYTSDDTSNLTAAIRDSELSTKRLQKNDNLQIQTSVAELFLLMLAKVCLKSSRKCIY